MYSKTIVGSLLLVAVLSTCCAADADKPADTAAVKLPRAMPPLFIAFNAKCPISDAGSPESPIALMLLGSLLKPLVETAVPAAVGWVYDKGVHAIESHNAKLQSSSTSVTTTVMYDQAAKRYQFGCVMLVRAVRGNRMETGEMYVLQEHGGKALLPEGSPWSPANAKPLANLLHIARVPEFYFELAFDSVRSVPESDPDILDTMTALLPKGKTSLTAAEKEKYAKRRPRSMYREVWPAHLDYFASGAERVNNGTKNVSVELHMDAMDVKGEWQPFYAKTYDLGKLKVNSSNVNVESLGKDTFAPPPLRRTSDGYLDPVPVRVTAILTEMDDNIDLARALETAFKDAQAKKSTVDAVAKVVVDKLQEKIDEKTGVASGKK